MKAMDVVRLVRLEHSLFALPFAYLGLVAAVGWPDGPTLFWVTLAMIGARTGAMAINRWADRVYDAQNPRTQGREIPRGRVSPRQALVLAIASLALFILAASMLNPLTLALSPIALLLLVGYSFTKRFTWASHLFLGLTLAAAPLGGWIAGRGSLNLPPLFLALGVMGWVAGFDILYALLDLDFDRQTGLYSIPACFGPRAALTFSRVLHAIGFVAFALFGQAMGWGSLYLWGLLGVLVLLLVQSKRAASGDPGSAFFWANAGLSLILFLAGLMEILRGGRI